MKDIRYRGSPRCVDGAWDVASTGINQGSIPLLYGHLLRSSELPIWLLYIGKEHAFPLRHLSGYLKNECSSGYNYYAGLCQNLWKYPHNKLKIELQELLTTIIRSSRVFSPHRVELLEHMTEGLNFEGKSFQALTMKYKMTTVLLPCGRFLN